MSDIEKLQPLPGPDGEITLMSAGMPASVDAHPDDLAVDQFATALKAKLADARAKGRGGWHEPGLQQRLSDMLREHIDKGDPLDVAAFAMFLHQRGEAILPAPSGEAIAYAVMIGDDVYELETGADNAEQEARRIGAKVVPLGRIAHPATGQGKANCKGSGGCGELTLTDGQIRELYAFAGDSGEVDPDDQTRITIRHCSEGHSGPGLYAHYAEYPEEGAMLLDGKSQLGRRLAGQGVVGLTDAQCEAVYHAVSRANLTRDIKSAERLREIVRNAVSATVMADAAALAATADTVVATAIAKFDEMVDQVGGCGDGSCAVKRPTGLHTNGGCRCWRDTLKAQRVMRAAQELRAALPTSPARGDKSNG